MKEFLLVLILTITLVVVVRSLVPEKEYCIQVGSEIGELDTDLGNDIERQIKVILTRRNGTK